MPDLYRSKLTRSSRSSNLASKPYGPALPSSWGQKARRVSHTLTALALAAGSTLGLFGCNDSFLDPSVTGRWENTPTIVPILDRIATIEDDSDNSADYSDPLPEDLIPQAFVYRITPGDALEITLYDLIVTDRADVYPVLVDSKGMIDVPQLGRVTVGGKTSQEAVAELESLMKRLVSNPLAQVTVINQRGDTYSIVGNVERAGSFIIPNSNYHLLEALTSGGRFQEDIEDIYVIRRISLETRDEALNNVGEGGTSTVRPGFTPMTPSPVTPSSGDDLLKIIDEVTGPDAKKSSGSPAVFAAGHAGQTANNARQPEAAKPRPVPPATEDIALDDIIDLPGDTQPDSDIAAKRTPAITGQPPSLPAAGPAPAVDLDDNSNVTPGQSPFTGVTPADSAAGRWVFLNGKWIQVTPTAPSGLMADQPGDSEATMTQRVIRIPTKELLAGKQRFNIVIRPGDVIRVPAPPGGLVYMAGQVGRPGPITIPPGGLTLLRALDAAGGLSTIAIPERIDLTRMIGRDRQATITLNGRAVSEQTQPDVYLKANDRINVGTSFWALPVAVIRNGFRMNYGFGFLIDRNFGNDVFGPPPDSNRQFN